MASHVYRPVIDGADWGAPLKQMGYAAISSGISSLTVTLPSPELDTAYYILLQEEGASIGRTMRITAKTVNDFTIGFTGGSTTGPGGVFWQVVR